MRAQADATAAKACTERQLQLARTLNDQHGKGDAFLQLGGIAGADRDWGTAHEYYEQALRVAEEHADAHSSAQARCELGLAQGNEEFDAFMALQLDAAGVDTPVLAAATSPAPIAI